MIEHELTGRSPLRAFDPPGESAAAGRTALVVARAGTGKTAFLVQVAIDALLRGQPVLHASWGETLAHVKSWYEGVWRDLCAGLPAAAARVAWERFEPRRMLMTFRAGSGTVERLVERLATLEEDGGFAPRLLVVDGFRLDEKLRADAERLAKVAANGRSTCGSPRARPTTRTTPRPLRPRWPSCSGRSWRSSPAPTPSPCGRSRPPPRCPPCALIRARCC